VYFHLLTRSIDYATSNISCSSSLDMEAFHMNKTLGRARAEEDTSLPQDNGHKQYLCVTNRFAVWSQSFCSFRANNVIPDTVHHSTYRKVRIFTLTSIKESLCWNSIVGYSKDTLYKKPNEILAKVIAQRATGWDQETVTFGKHIQLDKNTPWTILKYYIPHSKYRLVRLVTNPAVRSKRLAIESILWSRLFHVIFYVVLLSPSRKGRVSVLN